MTYHFLAITQPHPPDSAVISIAAQGSPSGDASAWRIEAARDSDFSAP